MEVEIRCPFCESDHVVFNKVTDDKFPEAWIELWQCYTCFRTFFVRYEWFENKLKMDVGGDEFGRID